MTDWFGVDVPEDSRNLEQWLPVVGHEGSYEVSDQGRVRSLPRAVVRRHYKGHLVPHTVRGRILKVCANGDGYSTVSLGKNNTVRTHRIVAEAFLGPSPFLKAEVCHNDGNGLNNYASNLRWDTRSNNHKDKVKHGTHNWGNGETCGLGHELRMPNLVRSEANRKNRPSGKACLSCCRAKANKQYADKTGRLFDWEANANLQYQRIMNREAA